jgi:hypothetical protein
VDSVPLHPKKGEKESLSSYPKFGKAGLGLALFVLQKLLPPQFYSASHSRVASENVGLQKEQKCNTFVCNEVRLRVLGIRKKEVGNTKN